MNRDGEGDWKGAEKRKRKAEWYSTIDGQRGGGVEGGPGDAAKRLPAPARKAMMTARGEVTRRQRDERNEKKESWGEKGSIGRKGRKEDRVAEENREDGRRIGRRIEVAERKEAG